ncbi:MAG: ABC-ATPase domain-containing protein [Candidatus Fermentibacterota bacterium]
MQDERDLRRRLEKIDGRGYKAYRDIEGRYSVGPFTLFVDHVQSDPFAPPSRMRARLPQRTAGMPEELFGNSHRRRALEDLLTRRFAEAAGRYAGRQRGTGKSGMVAIDAPGQEVLERTSMVVCGDWVEARFAVGLPAGGRKVMGRKAFRILADEIPQVVEHSLMYESLDSREAARHVEAVEDQAHLRSRLPELGLVAFVADGSVLPRRSGVSDLPMAPEEAVAFRSPPELRTTVEVPNAGSVTGMGLPEGVTLIVGGGYHGKSTLLRAIERGVYDHVPGDGREAVVSLGDACKVRAEDGRSVREADIHHFIGDLPGGQDTSRFTTDNASGSTSQATNIVEALESGSRLLLLDEDTSATNFMIRDARMQTLVAEEHEPITPFIDRVREIHDALGVSTVLVLGGSGDYIDVADHVLMMREYRLLEATEQAREVAAQFESRRRFESRSSLSPAAHRAPKPGSFRLRGRRDKVRPKGLSLILYRRTPIDLSLVEQLVSPSQTRAIARIMVYMYKRYLDGSTTLSEAVDRVMDDIAGSGLDAVSPFDGHPGELALPRKQEICAAVNRFRDLSVRQAP